MQRRDFLKTAAKGALGLSITPLLTRHLRASDTAANPQTKRPNILLIMADDLNHWVGYIGRNPQTRTPNLDRFAKQSVAFDHAYCAVPLCNPSRCAIFSGMRASTTGIYNNENLPWRSYIDETKALNGHLKTNGYYTAGAGKIYHNGGRGAGPDSQGVQWDDFFLGGAFEDDESSDASKKSASKTSGKKASNTFYGQIEVGSPDIPDSETGDNAIARWTISQLRKKHDKPFFIAAGFHKPHLPLVVPKKYFDKFPLDTIELPPRIPDDIDDLPPAAKAWVNDKRWGMVWRKGGDEGTKRLKAVIQAYLAAIAFTDAQMGLILDALDKSQYKDNTIVIVMADHGYHWGEKQRLGKSALWEEATRVPYMWRVPGLTPPDGAISSRVVESFSLFPTLCDLIGLSKPAKLQGVSIKPLLENPACDWTRPAVTTNDPNNHCARTDRWRYIRYANGDEELYDVQADPNEWRNLAADPNPKYASVKAGLAKWLPAENVPNRASQNKAPPGAQEKRASARRRAGAKADAAK